MLWPVFSSLEVCCLLLLGLYILPGFSTHQICSGAKSAGQYIASKISGNPICRRSSFTRASCVQLFFYFGCWKQHYYEKKGGFVALTLGNHIYNMRPDVYNSFDYICFLTNGLIYTPVKT